MDKKIYHILQDLYQLEPSLQQHEQRLVKIVGNLIAAKPKVLIDQEFVQNLRRSLLVSGEKTQSTNMNFQTIKSTFMQKLKLTMGMVAVVAIIVVGGAFYLQNQNSIKVATNQGVRITATSDYAFGSLDSVNQVDTNAAESDNATSEDKRLANSTQAYGIGGVGGGAGGTADLSIFPPGDYPTYRYVYSGEELNLEETRREVLKRIKGQESVGDFSSLLNSLSFGLVNIGSFPNLRLQSASFVQPGDNGYSIYVNADDSSISINGAWPVYATMSSDLARPCFEGDCGSFPPPVQLSDIPADSEMIAAANQFVNNHGIPVAAYGEPVVQDEWRTAYNNTLDKSTFYLPEVINVVYPLLINDQFVYDEGGMRVGLQVGVNIRNKTVVSVWDLTVQNYQSSMYDAETNVDRILAIAERGGMYGYIYPEATRIVDIELGTPAIEFVRMWNYKSNLSEELLIPSLVFPVINAPDNEPYFRRSVSVPLVKEILDRDNGTGGGIMPLRGVDTPAVEPAQQ